MFILLDKIILKIFAFKKRSWNW